MSWFSKFKRGLSKTAALFTFGAGTADLEAVEEALWQADVGVAATEQMMAEIRHQKPSDGAEVRRILRQVVTDKMAPVARPLTVDRTHQPFVVLMIGVNGSGKTTTIGKLGGVFQTQGLRVALIAADTFRAGATEQLCRWGERLHCPVYTAGTGADAAGLVFDGLEACLRDGTDVVFIDTAGRLQNRTDLMDELKKITRVIHKKIPDAPHATVLVLDATVGQNALSQVRAFQEAVGITGLVMTKLDGTAKGGILVALADKYALPIYAVGVGEGPDDLQAFSAADYAASLMGDDS